MNKRHVQFVNIAFTLGITALLVTALLSGFTGNSTAATTTAVFVNEIHYDNDGTDASEGVEVAGPAGTDLTGWQLIPYNGNGGVQYSVQTLSGTIPDQQNGYGTVFFAISGLQNGAPDGIALVDASSTVIQFLSYEGAFAATDGPATGLTSVDIGVSEVGTTPAGDSLQLVGTGTTYEDFTWNTATIANTYNAINTGQIFYVPGLTLIKEVTPDTIIEYQSTVTYTIALVNETTTDDTVLFTDTLPTEVDFGAWVEMPTGAAVAADEITWSGTVTASEAITFTFTANHVGDYGDVVTNTAAFSGTTQTGTAEAVFNVENLTSDITFTYHDSEDVVQSGEAIYLAGDFNSWNPTATPLTADGAFEVFSATVTGLAAGDYGYKYIVYTDTVPSGPANWDWLNTNNRTTTVSTNATVDDYRNVAVGWANLQWPQTMTGTMGIATDDIYGRLYIQNVTNPAGEGRGLKAEVGYGDNADPSNWDWFPMIFHTQTDNNDEFMGMITPTLPGVFSYTTRYDGNWGVGNPNAGWVYGDLTGVGPYSGGDFSLSDTGVVTVSFAAVPIATARAGTNGEVFGLEGIVTAPNGTWNNAPEWTFQDTSGGIAAYFVPDEPIELGDTIQMVATRGAYNNQEQMTSPVYFEVVSHGTPVEPITYTTGVVASGSTEGWLVEIEGVVGGMPATCGSAYNITLNDGSGATTVRIESATGINLCNLGIRNGDNLGVTGFSTQYQNTYQVKPRSVADLELFVDNPIVLQTVPTDNALNVPTNTLISIQFNEPVTVTEPWFTLECSSSGVVSASVTPAGPAASYTLSPSAAFEYGETCQVTIPADQVSNAEALNMLSDYHFNFTTGPAPDLGSCGDPAIPINFIQGEGDTTPILGATVVIEAVVVGDYQGTGQFSGFFLQEEAAQGDGDPNTSEGIFVYSTAAVSPGDLVRVRGTATEYNNLTQIGSGSSLVVCDSGQTITPTAAISLPVSDMTDWEALEGMLLSFTDELIVTEHYNLGRYGEIQLSINDRLWNPTNVVNPGAEALAMQDLNNRSRIMLDDALNVQNPDPVIYPDPRLTYTDTLRTGAIVEGLTGVLDYRNNTYRIQPVGVISFTHTADRPYEVENVGGTLRVASFNVLNYFTTLGSRGANTASEFERQRTKIINAILDMDADIVGLIEIENHPTDEALINLVDGLNAQAGAGTYAYIATGEIGTDEIKQAFIYQPATVTPEGDYAILDSTTAISGTTFDDTRNRPAIIQTFAENSTRELVTVAVNHLKSKGSECVGDPDIGDGQGNCNVTRTNAAEALVAYLATDPTGSGSANTLIIGDLNSYAMEDPITAIRDAGYTDLLRHFDGTEAYSYVFDGQAGYLDHALASPDLLPFVTDATAWHINADEPRVLDYNEEFKTAQQIIEWYSPEPFRASDHDPVVVGLELLPPSLTITKMVTSTANVDLGDVVTYTLTLENTGGGVAYSILLTDTLPTGITFGGWAMGTNVVPDYADGVITWTGDLPAGVQPLTIVFTATVNNDPTLYEHSIVNTAEFTSDNAGEGEDDATFAMLGAPVLALVKTVEATAEVDLGDVVTYTLTLSNSGEATAVGINLTDTLPTGVTFEAFVAADGATQANGVITWEGDLVAGEDIVIIFTVTADDDDALYGTEITNTASFTSANDGSGSDEAIFTVKPLYRIYLPVVAKGFTG
ncbi:MAG: ExeM/NucH family extracellular endonuclease [Anaerolineae bacterium]|nr:ExeM/NucH family extracellular endonuclease [Anaerolineae bacterium]